MIDLRAAKEACERATSGPWHVDNITDGQPRGFVWTVLGAQVADAYDSTPWNSDQCEANARFIAIARSALPACIAEVERLRALLAEVWDIAESRKCLRNDGDPPCACERLREIGEQESTP